jgi:hypothetical protein
MSPDPFEHLRRSNPLPEDQPVYPPMSLADRIAGGAPRRAWPAWAVAGAVALAVLVGGGSWLLWLHGGSGDIVATSTTPTTAAVTTTAALGFPEDAAVVYFYADVESSTRDGAGPCLIAVARPYSVLSHMVEDPVYETLNFLVFGPYPGEQDDLPPLLSFIPEGTQLLGVEVAGGIATVNLSAGFRGGDDNSDAVQDAAAVRRAAAQIVFTLTRFPEITGVRILVEGVALGDAIIRPKAGADLGPATRADFADFLPPIMIEQPVYWASAGENPLAVAGTADVFEATVSLELLDQHGTVLWQGFATATCGTGCRGDFAAEIPYEVAEGQIGTLVAWETSMEDGSRTNVRRHPVWLNATPGTTTTTDPVDALAAERYDLDKALNAYLEELATIDAQLAGLPLDQGAELRTRAAELDRQVSEHRDLLRRVFDELRLLGADFPIPCSAEALGSELESQPDLPQAVAELRHQVYEAARACDWDQLRNLVSGAGGFSYSFGENGDPVGFWQRMEFLHYEPMLYIASLLARPYGVLPTGELPTYAWPAAHTYASWAEVPEAEKEALRPLYGDLDFSFFEEFGGYLGYRIGITLDGDRAQWVYAITGD